MAGKCRAIHTAAPTIAVVVVAVVMAVAVTGAVAKDASGTPSSLTSWSARCSGDTSTIATCGCTDLVYYGGQEFHYRGEAATLYSETGCTGRPYHVVDDIQFCGDFGWRSVNIDC